MGLVVGAAVLGPAQTALAQTPLAQTPLAHTAPEHHAAVRSTPVPPVERGRTRRDELTLPPGHAIYLFTGPPPFRRASSVRHT